MSESSITTAIVAALSIFDKAGDRENYNYLNSAMNAPYSAYRVRKIPIVKNYRDYLAFSL
ncbi:hypothetical protein [Rivularia sp. UHCC 0363]|uniref:hypothetical protein n=1 Tax=Rivularia sp. UHCC 0363 TaxID=3110244 RepID=UPI002B1F10AE|nr:hypothetical protein [Rivularia sp. UHCC 0363]MEA5595689.1 hypothetical protein [Rivularia sp. UHCC 0363]